MRGVCVILRTALIVAVILFALNGKAAADVLLSTFGDGDSFDLHYGHVVGYNGVGNFAPGDQFSFTGSQSYCLDRIELAARLVQGGNELCVSIMTDAGGEPGIIIESFSFVDKMTIWDGWGDSYPPLVGTSVSRPLLTPGTNYWLVASAPDSTLASWQFSSLPLSEPHAFSRDGDPWFVYDSTPAAFRVVGTPCTVPAPGAILLGTLGAGLVAWMRRGRTV